MSVNRRLFLQQSALAAAACAAGPLFAWGERRPDLDGGPDAGHSFMHHRAVSRQSFEGLLGASFLVSPRSGSGSPVWLRLQAVEDPPPLAPVNLGSFAVLPKVTAPAITTTGYVLTFSGPGTSLPQETYIFENDRLGKFPLFVVPGGPGLYIAVFNLLNAPPRGRFITPSEENPGPAGKPGPAPESTRTHGPASERQAGATGDSGSHLPAEELVEPVLRDEFKAKLPE
jgi:hypothetical protein